MNNEFKMPKDLRQMAISAFRQDPKLTVAIDKLQAHNLMADSNEKRNYGLVLPDRKLNFQEVRQLLSRTDETIKGIVTINTKKKHMTTKRVKSNMVSHK